MSDGFKIADAFVDVKAEDNTRRDLSKVDAGIMSWGDKLAKRITGYFTKGFDEGTAEARKKALKLRDETIEAIEDINAKKLKIDADILRATAKIKDLKEKAEKASGDRKIQYEADIAAAQAKLVLLGRQADKLGRKHIELKVDLDRQLASRALSEVAQTATSMFSSMFRRLSEGATSLATNIGTSIATAITSGSAMTAATGGINLLVGAVLALVTAVAMVATGFLALAPILLVTGGAAGSLFTIIAGGIASVAVLKMGLGGLGDALADIGKDGKVSEETLAKMSKNGRLLAHELERLKGPLDNLRKFVQDKLLAGMNLEIKTLASKWLPALKPMLGDLATRFNGFAKQVMTALGKPDFIDNIRAGVKGFGDFIDRLGKSIPGLIGAFGKLAKGSVPFLKEIGDLIGGLVDKFSAWIATAEKSGDLDKFMKGAAKALRDIWDISGLVFGIVGDIIEIFFPSSKRASGDFLGGVKVFLQEIKDWLGDPKNQKKIQDWIDKIQDFVDKAATEWIPKAIEWMNKIDGWVKKVEGWIDRIKDFARDVGEAWDKIKEDAQEKWDSIVAFFTGLPERVRGALAELPGKVREKFQDMANQAAERVGYMIGSAVGSFIAFPGRVADALAALPGKVSGIFNSARTSAVTGASSLVSQASSWLSQLPGRASSALSALPGRVSSAFSSARSSATSIASQLVSQAVGTISGLPGRARSALGDLGGVLWSAGYSLIQGLIRGIRDAVPGLEGTLRWVTSLFPKNKGPIEKDRKLLEPAGKAIMSGLMRGIDSEVPALRDQLQGLTGAIQAMGSGHARAASGSAGGGYHFAAGSIVLDASKIKSIQDLMDLIENLKVTSRTHRVRPAYVGAR